MFEKQQVAPGVFVVLSDHQCPYAELLDLIPSVEWIDVVFEEVSEPDLVLEAKLREVGKQTAVRLLRHSASGHELSWHVSERVRDRLPKRSFWYKTTWESRGYFSKDFRDMTAFLDFADQVKLIFTDRLSYMGSVVPSLGDGPRYECGILFWDSDVVHTLRNILVDPYFEHRFPDYPSDVGEVRLWIHTLRKTLEDLLLRLADGFLVRLDELQRQTRFSCPPTASVSLETLRDFRRFLDEWEADGEYYQDWPCFDKPSKNIDDDPVELCRSFVESEDSPLVRMAVLNLEKSADKRLDDYLLRSQLSSEVDSLLTRLDVVEVYACLVQEAFQAFLRLHELSLRIFADYHHWLKILRKVGPTRRHYPHSAR